ncbi:Bgt-3651 [Blumeria graminis f. sp. tritici]|uniref:Bgt-3651 n=2 Tax=Blumeria graminis f. sp. tritici TaxID=62690 RepID=A0A061HMM0_BLUGR|nr:Subunit of the anaphase-promoting complex/cyclosome [Blumeria graminis f. sp. tritici 96224]VDB86097.1 Bgt-3651 [Blumeria graminis f. sp. tritici]
MIPRPNHTWRCVLHRKMALRMTLSLKFRFMLKVTLQTMSRGQLISLVGLELPLQRPKHECG